MSKIINIGVLGCSSIASRYMIPSILQLPEYFNLVGIASRYSDKAQEFALRFKTAAFKEYGPLLDISPDAIYIPLPNSLHAEWIEKALCKDIHVLVEKSLACSYQDVLDLNELAKERGLVLVENFQFRFHNQLKKIQEIIKCGTLGNLRTVRSSFGFPPLPDKANIRYVRELGGGSLLDAGAYPLKLSQIILGNDIIVEAASLCIDKRKNVDLWGGGFVKQSNGSLFAEISFGFDNYYQCNLEVWGSKGKLVTNRIFTAPPGYEAEINIESSDGIRTERIQPDNHFINMLKHFYKLILGTISPDDEYLQNIKQAELIQQFRERANE